MKRIYMCLFLLCVVILVVGCSSASPAQKTVDGYLNALKNGKDTSVYKDSRVADFIYVLEYKYLNVESSRVVDYITTINQESFQKTYRLMYPNLAEAIAGSKRVYGEKAVVSETPTELVIRAGGQEEYVLLYDVTHTNSLGHKLYGKFYFTVLQKLFEKEYEIVSWHKQ